MLILILLPNPPFLLLFQKMVNTGKGTGVPDPGYQNITDAQEMTFQIQPITLSFRGLACEPRK